MRPVAGRQRGYSDSSSSFPMASGQSQVELLLPASRRQRGYSDASSFSNSSGSSTGRRLRPPVGLHKRMTSLYPADPGRDPKLDNSVLQGIWDIYRKEAGDYDAAMIDSWNASIDNLILFVCSSHIHSSVCPRHAQCLAKGGINLHHHHHVPHGILQEFGATSSKSITVGGGWLPNVRVRAPRNQD